MSLILYDALVEVARHVAQRRGYCAAVSQVHFFVPGEVVADACAMARSTMYRALKHLKELELVEARAHYVTHDGKTKADGMVWAVKMDAERPGRVRVPFDALKASYRCLSGDIEAGRTAWAQTRQSKEPLTNQIAIQKILNWALPPSPTQNPATGMTVSFDLEAVLDVPGVDKADRRTAVDNAAHALAGGLADWGWLPFYRRLLWQCLKLEQSTGAAPWYTVYEQATRARTDVREGFARGAKNDGSGGGLFVSRLKKYDWWDELQRASGASA